MSGPVTYDPIIFVDDTGKFLCIDHPTVKDDMLDSLEQFIKTMARFQNIGTIMDTTLSILSEDSAIDMELPYGRLVAKQDWLTIANNATPWRSLRVPFSHYLAKMNNLRSKIYVIAKLARQPSRFELANKHLGQERLSAASRLLDTSADYFSDEPQRHAALVADLEVLLSSGRFSAKETTLNFGNLTFKQDGIRPASCPLAPSLLNLLWELNNGMGLGDSDPIERATRGYMIMVKSEELVPLRRISCIPVFLLGITGPNLTVSGAVYLDGIVTEHLTDVISLIPRSSGKPIEYNSKREALVHRIAHIFTVLDECLVDLDEYYRTVEAPAPDTLFPAPHFASFVNGDEKYTLSYTDRRFPLRSQRTVFNATLTSPMRPDRECIVKFTDRYNADAHRLMYDAGVAPELIHCQYEPDHFPTNEAIEKLKAGFKLLHDNDYVFGDLRDANIIVNSEGNVFLIDFDWCDKVGHAFYPHDLNTNGVTYAAGVEGGHAITKAHDEEMLDIYIASIEQLRRDAHST
ncbi:hypothetical protein ONZ45_g13040 [Pleurotus djamor]|nr:hypothetical protein ONZ45_g13040 [Pleurotus djamor]